MYQRKKIKDDIEEIYDKKYILYYLQIFSFYVQSNMFHSFNLSIIFILSIWDYLVYLYFWDTVTVTIIITSNIFKF